MYMYMCMYIYIYRGQPTASEVITYAVREAFFEIFFNYYTMFR